MKDESNLDRFDRCSATCSRAWSWSRRLEPTKFPAEWLKHLTDKFLTEEEKKQIEEMGGFDKLMEMLAGAHARRRRRRDEDGEGSGRHRRQLALSAPTATTPRASASARTRAATARRSRSGTSASTRTSTTTVELGTRNIKVALRRLRKFARPGAPTSST